MKGNAQPTASRQVFWDSSWASLETPNQLRVLGVRHCAAARPAHSWESADRALPVVCAGICTRGSAGVVFKKEKKRKERNLDGSRCYSNASLRGNSTIADPYSQDARTCVKCSRPSAGAGKVRAEQFLCFFSLKCCGLKKRKIFVSPAFRVTSLVSFRAFFPLTSAPLNGARRIKGRLSTKVC